MGLKILVVTPDRNFGEQISQALQDVNLSPLLVQNTAEASFIAQVENYPIAIIDCELTNSGSAELVAELRKQNDNLRLVFIPNSEECTKNYGLNPSLDISLPRPFFMPDLIEIIKLWVAAENSYLSNDQQLNKTEDYPFELSWLQDTGRAEQYFSRLSTEIDTKAVFLIQGDRILIYSGNLPKSEIARLADIVSSHLLNGDGSDLACFVNTGIGNNEYMLYATILRKEIVLALVFAKDVPFSKIRNQAVFLAQSLTTHPKEVSTETLNASLSPVPGQMLDRINYELDIESDVIQDDHRYDERNTEKSIGEYKQALSDVPLATSDKSEPSSTKELQPHFIDNDLSNQLGKRSPDKISEVIPKMSKGTPPVRENFRVDSTNQLSKEIVNLEPESFAYHNLAYSCLLIPRLPEHKLTGILVNLLKVEMSRLCLAYGWRLEFLDITDEFLFWVVSITPDVAAIKVIENIRFQTSKLLFSEFPRLAKENPSSDFWAPGYVVVHGKKSLPESLINNFLMKIRARQGVGIGKNINNA